MSKLKRIWHHSWMTRFHVGRTFPARVMQSIEQAIEVAEQQHGGEIRFALERELSMQELLRDVSPRTRALQLFGELGVWDTEHNNGVLIYVLLADHDVEIIADRGFAGRVSDAQWSEVCSHIEHSYRQGAFERGTLSGIAGVSDLIAKHFPYADKNELPNQPVLL